VDVLSVIAVIVALAIVLGLGPTVFTARGRQQKLMEKLEKSREKRAEREERRRAP
jgi:hypothetical protein